MLTPPRHKTFHHIYTRGMGNHSHCILILFRLVSDVSIFSSLPFLVLQDKIQNLCYEISQWLVCVSSLYWG